MESVEEVLLDCEDKMEKSIAFLHEQFSGIRTGKASPALVENVQIPYYGTPTRLRELANISTPEPRLIVINAYDPTALGEIEKAILAANLGVTPMNDGRVVRVPIPELNEERRTELGKVARRMAEDTRVAVRNVRREAEIRKGGRTSKTPAGAKRRGVIMTVLASLQTRFAKFTLDALLSFRNQL